MIFGIGTDLVAIARIEASYRRFGRHFVERILMPAEVAIFDRLPDREPRRVRFLAQRFAAKEAIVKALVDSPDEVRITEIEGQHSVVLELAVAPDDVHNAGLTAQIAAVRAAPSRAPSSSAP